MHRHDKNHHIANLLKCQFYDGSKNYAMYIHTCILLYCFLQLISQKEIPFILIKDSSELAFFQNSEDESFVQAYKIATENKFIQPHSENIQKDMHSGKVAVFLGNLN